jgi:hypothetical protein
VTVSTPTGKIRQLVQVTWKYSSNASTTVTVTLNSGVGSTYDVELHSNTLSDERDYQWIPDENILILDNDVIDALGPALGLNTIAVAIYTRLFE